ncbi:54S ribosomal protein L6 mitochondrial [Mucor velutinosus]|uniref:54S ribosomal protein L6 mitochondrial n=1 Tax=Mucor velutinosus TaxID=708070 RepID=A0AAN7I0U1_9FUNG|nr:54S ribosomal protein L6 mitochondrial [Mucor velutinosus]
MPSTASATTMNHEILANQHRRISTSSYALYPTATSTATTASYYLPPITTNVSFSSILHKKVLDQSEQQWESDVSQSAIIINEKQVTIPSPVNNSGDHHSIGSQSDDQTPTHIVSPEAIREALKEEKEEAMGHSQRRPFSKFTSFHALKQRRYSTDQSPSPPPPFPPVSASSGIINAAAAAAAAAAAPPPSPPSFTIPFSPPPSIKANLNYDDFDDSNSQIDSEEADALTKEETHVPEEPDTPCPSNRPTIALEKLKRPPNAYLLFNRDMRRKLLKQSPKMTVAEISKEVGDWWKALPDVEREYYVKKASILKEEHLKKYPDFIYTRRSKAQLAEAKKTSKLGRKLKSKIVQKYENQQPAMPNNNATFVTTTDAAAADTPTEKNAATTRKRSRKFNASGGQRDPRGRKKKRHKHPFAPKHPMSAYLYYLASVYPQVSLNFPGSTVGPISKSISKTWHAMSPEERLPWKQKADSDKARYAREMQAYMAANNHSTPAEEEDEEPKNRVSDDSDDESGEVDVDVHMLAAVVNMVNTNPNDGNLMYHRR